ncbi:ABC transporter substrate-binding protein [Burkholderia vietnamiensis]|jgi:hypothetical protein|uniref:DUF5983 family protein n=1 Tax=Burkholderia cepacia complex TaxID=87882 RepID=UPI000761BB0A|nr:MULTISPECIES: hypothetical protein [Burkholderia cepacia complex]KVS36295.1 ABC transporter substrate-binding protein [Burkholderia vietnamiensis]MBU9638083.1 ABC transporter substrate-binding protein [Burkholderia multivorans]PRF01512.1 ABC transporter substrate-binding protein [Burkholderia multivorans]PRG41438.1 ABC transporter substrate-binding protein [Burkholderia multivorans]
MFHTNNPFARGYQNLRVIRTLCISFEDGSPLVWRSIHGSQAHLPDEELAQSSCIVANDFALIGPSQIISDELARQCTDGEGIVRAVVYAIYGDDIDGHPVYIGDTYSEEAAHETVQRLRFETGHYSRCWEISRAHLSVESWHYLANLADLATPTGFLFIAFRIPYSPAIGVKLIATPWTDANLEHTEGISIVRLRQEHVDHGLPTDLADVLHLAGEADVRILIFDADAPALEGLAVHET